MDTAPRRNVPGGVHIPHRAAGRLGATRAAPQVYIGARRHPCASRPANEGALKRFLVANPTKIEVPDGNPAVAAPNPAAVYGRTFLPTGIPRREGGRDVGVATGEE